MPPKKHIYPKIIFPRKLHTVYKAMMSRCYNPKHLTYKNYGGKGISVCDMWKEKSKCFYYWAIGNGYKEGLTLDRIDPNKGYSPENCRFLTMAENIQTRKSITKFNPEIIRAIRADCKVMTTREVAKKYKVSHHHLIDIKLKRAWNNVQDT